MEPSAPSPPMKSTAMRFKWSLRSTRGHKAHGPNKGSASGRGPDPGLVPVSRARRLGSWAFVVVGAITFQNKTPCVESYSPPDTSRKSFTRATLMK